MSTVIDVLISIALFVVVLGGLVLFHELGHFITARLARVRVLEFGVGFPPRAKVLGEGKPSAEDVALVEKRWADELAAAEGDPELHEMLLDQEPPRAHGTQYTLNWLPIGGFVKLEGEDGDAAEDPRSFARARLPIKLLILAAGVLMNLLLSLAIFTAIAWFASPYIGLKVGGVDPGSPAAGAGIVPGDAIMTLNGTRYDFVSSNHEGASLLDDLRANAGQTVTVGIRRADGTDTTVTVTLRSAAEVAAKKGALGITADKGGFQLVFLNEYTGRPLPQAVSIAWSETTRWFGLIIDGLGSLASSIVKDPTAAPPVSGPVGIATSLGETFRGSGIVMTLYVAGILSANLALVNVLPFPPLDGGRMFVILLKAIPRYGKKISLRAEQFTYAIGFMALFAFLIWITVFDIARQVTGGGTP
jgi:regulator of sigma E protease